MLSKLFEGVAMLELQNVIKEIMWMVTSNYMKSILLSVFLIESIWINLIADSKLYDLKVILQWPDR